MARIAGVDLPKNKRLDVALQYVYGVGPTITKRILEALKDQVDGATRVKDLTEAQVGLLNNMITKDFRVEGELRRDIQGHIKRLIEIGTYRGLRHRRNLPVRGQRTRTNARTRRGRRRTVGAAKPGVKPGAPAPAAKK